jgi:alcohol dehydrogenase (NADP+)
MLRMSKLSKNIDPMQVPVKILSNGSKIPAIGLGTFGSDNYSSGEIANAVELAIKMGYRHIDCASVYMNEAEIGQVLSSLILSGVVKREELWITSKVWNDMHGEGQVIESCQKSLSDLKLGYLDLYLVHWPFPNYHAPGCDGDARNPDSKPYIHEEYMEVWRQMEKLVEMGLVKNIGTSNMTIPKMELLLNDAKIKPVVNEMEIHPHFQQPELYQYMVGKNIVPIGYSPIGSPKRPERDKTPTDTVDIEDPVIIRIAERLNVHPAVVCLKWAVQRGQVTIPFSVKQDKMFSNLEAVTRDPITAAEMEELSGIDKNCRLIKGQVFLWEGAKSWEDLWDLDGTICK